MQQGTTSTAARLRSGRKTWNQDGFVLTVQFSSSDSGAIEKGRSVEVGVAWGRGSVAARGWLAGRVGYLQVMGSSQCVGSVGSTGSGHWVVGSGRWVVGGRWWVECVLACLSWWGV